jgi:hypothetical protein
VAGNDYGELMKILQIWYGDTPGRDILTCMRHNLTLQHDYCLCAHENWINAPEYVDINQAMHASGLAALVEKIDHRNRLLCIVDLLRVWFGSQSRVLYLDADCALKKEASFCCDVACFVQKRAAIDYYAFYSGDTAFFKAMFAKLYAETMAYGEYPVISSYRYINLKANSVQKMAATMFEHLNNRFWVNG